MAFYWCESCGGITFKSLGRLFAHLLSEHLVRVLTRGYSFEGSDCLLGKKPLKCNFCGEQTVNQGFVGDYGIWRSFAKRKREMQKHVKIHKKFKMDGVEYRTLRSLLSAIDKKYKVHVGFQKGITKRTVFLDGICST